MPYPTTQEFQYVRELSEDFFGKKEFLYFIDTFGCQQNVSDSEHIGGLLEQMGYVKTGYKTKADLVIMNSCAVRDHAEIKFLGHVGELKPLKMVNPKKIIITCGCMFSNGRNVNTIKASYPFIDIVGDTTFTENLIDRLADFLEEPKQKVFPPQELEEKEIIEGIQVSHTDKYNVSVPIMYGCDNKCNYCIVPYVRGEEVNREPEDIVAEITALVENGAKHITLLGQNVNAYGRKLDEDIDFVGLLKLVCAIPGNYIVSFLSSHPKFFTRELVDFIAAEPKMCRMLHIPVQAGSDLVLAAMGRGYTSDDYLKLISYATNTIKGVGFTSDVMIAYPGETEVEFDKTMDLVSRVGFYQLFTYIFSKRPGTPAATLTDDLIQTKKTDRMDRLLSQQKALSATALAGFKDKTFPVLVEKEEDGMYVGKYGNFLLIRFSSPHKQIKIGELHNVFITGSSASSLTGTVEE